MTDTNYEDDNWIEITKDHWNYFVDSSNHSIHLNLKNTLVTRFIKIRTIWDDRDIDNNNVRDYVTFKNDSIQKMIRIWTIEDSKNEFYEYDKNSNRISLETYTTKNDYAYYKNADNGNTARVMYDGKWWYTYDANGNRTARAMNADHNGNVVNIDKSGEYWEYEWDYHNRLVKVQQHNAPDNAANVCVEYTYDALNRRIERISRTNTEPEVTQYAYGRNGALAYQKKSVGEKHTERTFVYLNNQITAFADKLQNGSEKTYYTITDIQGSVTEVYDESQNLVWKSGYTAFGIKAGETTDLIDFDGLYTGCDYDTETGLTYHWNRWRSEEGNSWLSQDPARDGLNWYGYAGQNPANFVDLWGLEQSKADLNWASIVQKEYESVKNDPEKFKDFKSKFSIDIYRDKNDNHDNNKYYQSELCVAYNGIPLNSVSVQSTHDWVDKANRLNALKPGDCGTVEPGIYNGKLMASTPSFLDIIYIEGTFEGTEIHGDMFDNPDNKDKYTGEVYGEGKRPYSLSCQVVHQKDKLEINRILKSFGFIFTNKENEQDNIKVRINSPENPSIFTDRSHSYIKWPSIQSLLKKQEPYFTIAR